MNIFEERKKRFSALSPAGEEDDFPLARGWMWGYVALMDANGKEPAEGRRLETKPVDAARDAERRLGHPERFCPNYSLELSENRCKLSCPRCGFYLSCSDFY
jgi:hypothetical protein